ncbi:MAG: 2-amino-4-hydroxy-6-hydroxymethyldihydropteridine pyrophosphokinae [Solirubrobacterales bacterium]|nr:2-amino-4-hydroxy-6-hydroxymethyldihydropteridine pyrophosphokinae [Solirubrobacterales bacterium]
MTPGFLALGGNQGDRRASLQAALDALPIHGVTPTACSSAYATAAVGGPPGQPDYLNACVRIETAHSPLALLEACKAIERALGRPEPGEPGYVPHGPRPVDLDVLLLGRAAFAHPRLTIPHAALTQRRFVLVPLLELDFALELPDGTRLADALARLGVDEDVRRAGPPLVV